MSLTPTLIDHHNPGGGQLVQLYNPVQYTSVPNAVALLSPAQNLNRDGSATILIPSLMQPTDHHHHHHHHHQHQQPQPIVLNSTENVSALDHQARNLLPSLGSTSFSSIPLQTPYTFQTQISHHYSTASSPSPTQSYTVTPTSITNNSASNEGASDNSTRDKSKSKAKLIKRRSPRNRKAKENNQRLHQPLTVSYINQKPDDSDQKFLDVQVIGSKQSVDESPPRIRLISDDFIDEFDCDDEEPMESQDCDYGENQFIAQSGDDKGNFEYERIDDSAQCTSEDILRELSSHHNSTIRNVGVQSDELIDEPESPVKLLESADCSNQMGYNDDHETVKSVTDKDEEEETVEKEEDDNIDDDYSIHSNLPDDSEGSSEKGDQINSLKTTCEFVLREDDDSFNELEGNNYHDDDDDNDEDEFGIDGNTDDNDLLSSDDLSVHFVNSDNNNNISFEDDDDDDDDDEYDDNYENQNGLISMTTMSMNPITKQSDLNNATDAVDNYVEEEEGDDDNTSISALINPSSIAQKPADEGLYERLSNTNSNQVTVTTKDEDQEKNRSNKRLERLRKELRCYENNFDQTTAQSPPLSPQVRTFETGDLVWGQMRGNPSWPGKLVGNEDVPSSINGQTERGKVWVKWFGDNLVTQVELDKLKTLSEGLEAHHTARKKHRKGKKMDSCLDQAIQEAMMELDKQMERQTLSSSTTTKSHQKSTSSPSPPQPPTS